MASTLPPTTIKGLTLSSSTAALAIAGGMAFGRGFPTIAPPMTQASTVTLSTSIPAATPTLISPTSGLLPNTTNYLYSGGNKAIEPSNTFPFYTTIVNQQPPCATLGFGGTNVEFDSDAPALSIAYQRSAGGVMRCLVDSRDGRGFVEQFRITIGLRAGTAQAGGASTITLDSGASASNNFYSNYWLHISGGTGAGQYQQIKGYVGSTKVATMMATWSTPPDATSTFEITDTRAQFSNLTNAGVSYYYQMLDWGGERRLRSYKLEMVSPFLGVYVTSAIDTVVPTPKGKGPLCFWIGDSYSAGTGADVGGALSQICCDGLGWELYNISQGGTGYLNPGGGSALSLTARQRVLPPVNAWFIQTNGATGGSWSVTQNSLTATFNTSDTNAACQATLDGIFGAGTFVFVGGSAGTQRNAWIVGQGANGAFSGAMTANFASLTGNTASTTSTIGQYLGELAPSVPLDGNGSVLPFNIVIANGHNDTADSNAAYTGAAVQAEAQALISGLTAKYPLADIYVVGNMFIGTIDAAITACNAAIQAACNAVLPKINGRVPFINTLSATLYTGTGGFATAPTGSGTRDLFTASDNVHPWDLGHFVYGAFIKKNIQGFWGL